MRRHPAAYVIAEVFAVASCRGENLYAIEPRISHVRFHHSADDPSSS
jgi:hypothetical protein